MSWSPSGKLLATCGRDKTVWIWEKTEESEFECVSVITGHSQDVKRVKWHPKEPFMVSCSYDNTIRFIKETNDDWSYYLTLDSHESTVWAVDFNKSGDRLVSCSDDKTVRIWKAQDDRWTCISTLSGYHNRPIYDVSWSLNDNLIASSAGDNSIVIYRETQPDFFEVVTRKEKTHTCDVNSISWNPVESNLLASCGDDGIVKIWNIK